MEANKENLEKMLNKIGWSIKGNMPRMRIVNHDGNNSDYIVTGDRIEQIRDKNQPDCCFYFNGCYLSKLGNNTIALTARGCKKSVFILFSNYNIED